MGYEDSRISDAGFVMIGDQMKRLTPYDVSNSTQKRD